MKPLQARTALDSFFLEARCKLLDLAAILDRIDRGEGADKLDDARLTRIRQALDLLRDPTPGRAERVQQLFSLDYDPNWERPTPRF